jgi:hypothetical protein
MWNVMYVTIMPKDAPIAAEDARADNNGLSVYTQASMPATSDIHIAIDIMTDVAIVHANSLIRRFKNSIIWLSDVTRC